MNGCFGYGWVLLIVYNWCVLMKNFLIIVRLIGEKKLGRVSFMSKFVTRY